LYIHWVWRYGNNITFIYLFYLLWLSERSQDIEVQHISNKRDKIRERKKEKEQMASKNKIKDTQRGNSQMSDIYCLGFVMKKRKQSVKVFALINFHSHMDLV
jgi:GTP-binding protein EngB required for normal cell division